MKYESQRTVKGNVGISFNSQEEANKQAEQMDASNCIGCSNCSDCIGCIGCIGILQWNGPKTIELIGINGLLWSVATDGTNLQIGCQQHSVKDWKEFNDEIIKRMDSNALEFWQKWKTHIISLCDSRALMNEVKADNATL